MLLADSEGNNIQANVLNKTIHDQYRTSISEGQIYLFANFVVSSNESLYRASTHPFKITFTLQTHVVAKSMQFPDYSYKYFTIPDILATTEDTNVDDLIDVIALVKSIGSLEEYRNDFETKNRLRIVLTDLECDNTVSAIFCYICHNFCFLLCNVYYSIRGNDIECVLFDECVSGAYMCQLENINSTIVMVLNLARIGFSKEGKPQLSNSFNATRISFNHAIKEMKKLLQSAKERSTPVLVAFDDLIPKYSSQPSVGSSFHNHNKLTIAEIVDHPIVCLCCSLFYVHVISV